MDRDWDVPWMDLPYSGAPDECPKHWPTKLNGNGNCPECDGIKES